MQQIFICVVKRLVLPFNHHHGVFFVAPCAVVVDGDGDAELDGFEIILDKRGGADAEIDVVVGGDKFKRAGVGRGFTDRHDDLAARDGEGVDDGLRGGLPQPVADLVVVGFDVVGFGDVGVVAQAVEQLRAVGLRVDGLQRDVFDIRLFFRPFGFGFDIQTARALPHARHRREGAEVGEGVEINGIGFGVNVVVLHDLPCLKCRHSRVDGNPVGRKAHLYFNLPNLTQQMLRI